MVRRRIGISPSTALPSYHTTCHTRQPKTARHCCQVRCRRFDAFHFPEGATSQDVNALVNWIAQRSLLSVAQSVDERELELMRESILYFGTGTLAINDRFVRLNVERNAVVLYNRQTAAFLMIADEELKNFGFFVGEAESF